MEKKHFEIANDPNFVLACMDLHENKPTLQKNSLQTIGDRVKFLEYLEIHGFKIVKK
jgi:hypothetical protein